MRLRLVHAWTSLRSTYWFIPALMALVAGVLAVASVEADRYLAARLADRLGWVHAGGPEGARAVLSVVAGSVMSTAGVTFSITIAALSLASSQLGPRLLQHFMRDTANQVVLGTFIATFVFCLLVLRTIRGGGRGWPLRPRAVRYRGCRAGAGEPGRAHLLHPPRGREHPGAQRGGERGTRAGAPRGNRLSPTGRRGVRRPAVELPADFEARAAPVASRADGYVQAMDEDALAKIAERTGMLLRVEARPGQFVAEGSALVRAWPPEAVDAGREREIRARFVLGTQRTAEQDVEFAVDQLVEVAVRAMSPAINDPFTAIACLDWLQAGLCRAARGRTPRPYRLAADGRVCLAYRAGYTFTGLIDAAFNQVRQSSARSPAVMLRLLETIEDVVRCTGGERDEVDVLLRHAQMAHRAAVASGPDPVDRADLDERFRQVLRTCGAPVPPALEA